MAVPERISARQRHNILVRHYGADHPKVADAARDLKLAHAEDYIRELVDQAPPLTPEQRDKLATLLRPATSGGDAP